MKKNKQKDINLTENDNFDDIDIAQEIDNDENEKPKNNILHKIKIAIIVIIVIALIIVIAMYITNEDFREYIDVNIFNKQVTEDSLKVIELNSDDDPTVFAYSSYIAILSKDTLNLYNSSGNSVQELSINITNPIIETSKKYIVIAEEDGNEFYVINDKNILWQGEVDGNISKIDINSNGYVSVIVSNSTYNSIVILYDSNGTELFKTYLPSTYAMCSSVSTDNSCLAIGEIDYSGTVLKSNIRIMDIDSAETVYQYSTENNNIITNINYYDKENAVCTFTDFVVSISKTSAEEIYEITDDTYFVDIEMSDILAVLEKQSSGLFSYEYNLRLLSLTGNTENLYILNNSVPKQVILGENLIALNYGSEADIVNQYGTLKKKYTSTEQIKDIIVGNDIVGIVYKDEIEIIDIF